MTLFLFARFHARPGARPALGDAIHDVQGPTRKEPGCLGFHAFQSIRDRDEFFIHSRWRDQAAFDAHAAEPHTMTFVATAEALIDHPFSASLTEEIS